MFLILFICGVLLFIYYVVVFAAFVTESYTYKKDFHKDLIPFYGIYRYCKYVYKYME